MLTALTLTLTACGGPDSYSLRQDLCDVLDYQAFSRWFGNMQEWPGGAATDAKVMCVRHGQGSAGSNLLTRIEAYKYESREEAKKVFERFGKNKSDMDAELDADVDDARYYKGYTVLVLDSDLFLKVLVQPEAVDDSSFKDEMPRLTAELTDQVLERLREKS